MHEVTRILSNDVRIVVELSFQLTPVRTRVAGRRFSATNEVHVRRCTCVMRGMVFMVDVWVEAVFVQPAKSLKEITSNEVQRYAKISRRMFPRVSCEAEGGVGDVSFRVFDLMFGFSDLTCFYRSYFGNFRSC